MEKFEPKNTKEAAVEEGVNTPEAILAEALKKVMSMVEQTPGSNAYIPSSETQERMLERIRHFIAGGITREGLQEGFSGAEYALMDWAGQIAEERGL